MRIAIVGAGGVGGTLAARLALAGREVWVLARGDHGRAIEERGLQRGKPLELDHLNGAAVRLAAAAGLPAPANQAIVAALRPWAAGGPPFG